MTLSCRGKMEEGRQKSEVRGKKDDGRGERAIRGKMTERIRNVRDLVVYRRAFDAAMEIFNLSKAFPREELYSLTDQIRRSSRSVCANTWPVK